MVRDSTANSTKATNNAIISPVKGGISKPKEKGKRRSGTIQVPKTKAAKTTTTESDDDEEDDSEEAAAKEEAGDDTKAAGPTVEDTLEPDKDKKGKKGKKPVDQTRDLKTPKAQQQLEEKTKRFEKACALFSSVVKKGAVLDNNQLQGELKAVYDEFYLPSLNFNNDRFYKTRPVDIKSFFVRVHQTTRTRCLFGRLLNDEKEAFFKENLSMTMPDKITFRALAGIVDADASASVSDADDDKRKK